MYDTWKRSIAKGVSWFAIRFSTLFVITYYITGNHTIAGTLSTVFYSVGAILYIAHERIWNRFNYGIEAESGKKSKRIDEIKNGKTANITAILK